MQLLLQRIVLLLLAIAMFPRILPGDDALPVERGPCDTSDAIAAFVAAWNQGEPSLIPLLDKGTLAISDVGEGTIAGAVEDPAEYIVQRPARKDLLTIPRERAATIYASGRDPEAWLYVVQPMMRSIDGGNQREYQMVASVDCSTGAFGRVTLHEPTLPVVGDDGTQAVDSPCTAARVTQPVIDLLAAISAYDVSAIRALLYTPTGDERIDIRRLGEYSFLMPNGDRLRRGDAESFPVWIADQLASGWALVPLELYWSNEVPSATRPSTVSAEGMAGVQFFFLMVNEKTELAWLGIWKGVVIDCPSGTILSLHGGTA